MRHPRQLSGNRQNASRMNVRQIMGAGPEDAEVTGLAYDSRAVSPGTLFFCVSGFERDGHEFAPQAVEAGAVALVVERPLGLGVPEVVVDDVRAAMAPAAARFFGDPTAALRVAGITGTNGKTTTAWLVRHLLESAGTQCGLLGTVLSVIGGREEPVVRTTPEAIDLQATFARMRDAGDGACAMEVSSHALELDRARAIHWAVAVFTNLSRDHLDFHGDMGAYYAAKRRLFDAGPASSVVNVDDDHGLRLASEVAGVTTFAIDHEADWRALDVQTGLDGSAFRVRAPAGEAAVRSPLPGRFNVSNMLAALAAAGALGVGLEDAAAALEGFAAVPGRFEPVDEGQGFAVLVDYAHTPDSLENVLRAARGLTRGRVIVVFGAGGDRDRGKRPLMGEIAARLADAVVVTSDNPRSEDPEAIIAEILQGAGAGVEAIVDRRSAIARAIQLADDGDVVVIAGKGHEQGQEFEGGRKLPFDDVTVAREALRGHATV
jgi:UDP-N-acetylmuramoyl-L-alanyl-D-glutamate--2,6-diaminopimelate ligase